MRSVLLSALYLVCCVHVAIVAADPSPADPLCGIVAATNIEYVSPKWSCNALGEPTSQPCVDWPGVQCDVPTANGFVLEINLEHLGVNGTIPTSISQLTDMVSLVFSSNSLSGSVPVDIGSLHRLTYLAVSSNQLTGPMPTSLGLLTSLISISVQYNMLTGTIPAAFGGMLLLQELEMGDNLFSGSLPAELAATTDLVELLAFGLPSLTGPIPPEYCALGKLEILAVYSTSLSGSLPACIGSMTMLHQLQLFFNQLTGPLPESLGDCERMVKINIPGNSFTGSIPRSYGKMAVLENLYLNINSLTGGIPEEVGDLARLKELYLYENRLTGTVPTSVATLTNAVNVLLQDNFLSGKLPEFVDPHQLVELNLASNCFSGSIPETFDRNTLLFIMNVSCNRLTGTVPAAIASLTGLAYVSLYDNCLTGSLPLLTNPALASYNVSTNYFNGTIPALLSAGIGSMDISANLLSGSIPTDIANYSNLHFFSVAENGITGAIPSELCSSTSMSLDVAATGIQCYSGCLTAAAVIISGASSDCHDGSIVRFFLTVVFISVGVALVLTVSFRVDWGACLTAITGSRRSGRGGAGLPVAPGDALLSIALVKLLLVVVLSLTLNGWWQANDDSVVESCSSSAGPGSCYVFCGSATVVTATVTDDDYAFDDVHFPPNINTNPHYSEASYCVATLDGSCARKYWLIFRLVPIALHLLQFLLQCVAWWVYGNSNPQQRQYDVLVAYAYPGLLEHFGPAKEVTVVSTAGRTSSVSRDGPAQATGSGNSPSRLAMVRMLSQPRLFSVFAVVEVLSVLYVWGELLFPATYCGAERPLSLYYYPILLTLLDLMKFNVYVANRLARSTSGKHMAVFAFLNLEMLFSNTWLCLSLTGLFVGGVFYDMFRVVCNAIRRCRGDETPVWPNAIASVYATESDVATSTVNPILVSKAAADVEAPDRGPSADGADCGTGIRLSQHVPKAGI